MKKTITVTVIKTSANQNPSFLLKLNVSSTISQHRNLLPGATIKSSPRPHTRYTVTITTAKRICVTRVLSQLSESWVAEGQTDDIWTRRVYQCLCTAPDRETRRNTSEWK